MNDPYQLLGVSRSASADDIKKAYRKLAKQHHPDSGGDAAQFKKISQAYNEILESQHKKQERYTSADVNDFDDLFSDLFRQAGAGFHHSHYQQGNKDLTTTIKLELDEVLRDQTRTVNINTGRSQKAVQVEIPAGVNNGATIRYTGYGSDVLTRKPPGDLIVQVQVNHRKQNFERSSQCDIFSTITVDAIDAILGTTIEFCNLSGHTLSIQIPAGVPAQGQLRIRGQGLPKINSDEHGDLYLFVEISVPKNITSEQKQLLEEYRNISR